MGAQKGSDVALRIEDTASGSPTAFVAVGGLRSYQLQINSELVDISNADSVNKWREGLAGAGIKNVSISGNGVFKDDATDALVKASVMNNTHLTWQFDVPDFARMEGRFHIGQFEVSADHNGEVTYSISLESVSEVFARDL